MAIRLVVKRENPTTSEVLEEVFHFDQELREDYIDHEIQVMRALREIDAQNYLLSVTKRHNIPKMEVDQTLENLEFWQSKLKRLLDEGYE